jgi:heparanase 1
MNEPTYAAMGGAPKGYDAAAYGRDVAIFGPFIKQAAPGTIFLGPGSVGEGGVFPIALGGGMLNSVDLLKAHERRSFQAHRNGRTFRPVTRNGRI